MHKRIAFILIAVIGIVGYLTYYTGYVSANTFNPYQYALEHLAWAESAQTPNGVIEHVIDAKTELSKVGYVSWWSTDKQTFDSIQMQLDGVIARAERISSLELGDGLFNSGMYDIHGQLRVIQESLLAF